MLDGNKQEVPQDKTPRKITVLPYAFFTCIAASQFDNIAISLVKSIGPGVTKLLYGLRVAVRSVCGEGDSQNIKYL